MVMLLEAVSEKPLVTVQHTQSAIPHTSLYTVCSSALIIPTQQKVNEWTFPPILLPNRPVEDHSVAFRISILVKYSQNH